MDDSHTTGQPDETYARDEGRQVALPASLSALRQKLNQKARNEPKFRFYALYDRLYRPDVLWTAWRLVRANGGAAGVDGQSIADVEAQPGGPEALVEQLHEELRAKRYHPQPVRRVWIPKARGKLRPLGIPTVRDRVVQSAALLILEPIFEADFEDCSHGFRPQRSAHGALAQVRANLEQGRLAVFDADLAGYFDSIPHDKLLRCVEARVSDRSVLRLVRQWLTAPVEETTDGRRQPPTKPTAGTPQGGVISPLLANVYLHWLDRAFYRPSGPAGFANAALVRYADDFVVMAKWLGPRLLAWVEERLEGQMGLRLNREKTRQVDLRRVGATVDFLGYTFRLERVSPWRRRVTMRPSRKALAHEREVLRTKIGPAQCFLPLPTLVAGLNRHLQGWANYFAFGDSERALRAINSFVRERLTRHLQRKSQRRHRPPAGETWYRHLANQGLVYLRPARPPAPS